MICSRVLLALLVGLLTQASPGAFGFDSKALWDLWPEHRFVTTSAPCLRPAELYERLAELAERHPDQIELEEIGRSFLDRPIFMLTLGRGPRKILLWSQMHGDEPSATPALLDIVDYLLSPADDPDAEAILDNLKLLVIPMLNPDGAEVYERRNAQGIDINRDALNLSTPEGRLLKRIRDEHEPMLGFNLHDQNRRTAVGDTGVLATNAVLAVAGDPEGTLTPGRARAKRACAAIIEALAPLMPGGMARYDEDWSPRAFGDNLTAWGTPVVLIESGGLPPGREITELTRLNFVAILTVLEALVRNDLADHDPELYEALPRNESDVWSEVVVRGGFLLQPGTPTAYRADLAINLSQDDLHDAGCATEFSSRSQIVEIGDARFIAAGRDVDATDSLILALFDVGVEGWKARKWLDAETLQRLAGIGVGSVRWRVKKRHLNMALRHAAGLSPATGARLAATDAPTPSSGMSIDGPPPEPGSDLLRDLLVALGGRRVEEALDREPEEEVLGRFWSAGERPEVPAIRRRQPASFLLVSPAVDGSIDLGTARVESVWIDGREVADSP